MARLRFRELTWGAWWDIRGLWLGVAVLLVVKAR
jgi:hypothetical protein